jgi:hypothetical protein
MAHTNISAFAVEYSIPMSRERVISALHYHAVHWRSSETPDSLREFGAGQVEARFDDDTLKLFFTNNRFRSPIKWYELRVAVQARTAHTTIVQARGGPIRGNFPYLVGTFFAMWLIFLAIAPFGDGLPLLGFVLYLVGFYFCCARWVPSNASAALGHLAELLRGAMREVGGVTVGSVPRTSPQRVT